jgi:hypothetical protein
MSYASATASCIDNLLNEAILMMIDVAVSDGSSSHGGEKRL